MPTQPPPVSPEKNGTSSGEDSSSGELVEREIIEPVPLPRQYNITFIEVMIRDPFWVFAFWEIKRQDKERYQKNANFGGYHLKVSSLASPLARSKGEVCFTVSINPTDTAWYLGGFPASGTYFKVDLCVNWGQVELILASSVPFKLPHVIDSGNLSLEERALIRLSGIDDFQVLRDTERPSRIIA